MILNSCFRPGNQIKVSVAVKSLSCTILLNNNLKGSDVVKGLYGNFDGNPDNDLENRTGGLLSSSASARDIFDFGQSCKFFENTKTIYTHVLFTDPVVDLTWMLHICIIPNAQWKRSLIHMTSFLSGMLQSPSESYFWYNTSDGESFWSKQHPEFIPNLDPLGGCHGDQALINNATSVCRINGQVTDDCLYDYCSTGSSEFALTTLATVSANNNTANQLSRFTVMYKNYFWLINVKIEHL